MDHFWDAVGLYYFSIMMTLIFNIPALNGLMMAVAAILFLAIPSLSNVQLLPGIDTMMETQIEIIKTQVWLTTQ